MDRLIEMKTRLLAGNAEAARAGAAKAVPGAFEAASALAARAKKGEAGGSTAADWSAGWEETPASASSKGDADPKTKTWKNMKQKTFKPSMVVDREKLVAANRQIAHFAKVRDFHSTVETLKDLEEKGWANSYTYTAAINALCRCGAWELAEAALERATKQGHFRKGQGLSGGVVARTTMLKGFFDCAREMQRARALLKRMQGDVKEEARPNTRTANTFLRGCLLLGAVDDAVKLLETMEQGAPEASEGSEGNEVAPCAPDGSSYEYVVTLLCQSFRQEEAMKVARRCMERVGSTPGCAMMYVAAARSAALSKDRTTLGRALKEARRLLSGEKVDLKSMGEEHSGGAGAAEDAGTGGKRGALKGDDENRRRASSLDVFQKHRRAEMNSELQELERFSKSSVVVDLGAIWSRTLAFEDLLAESRKKGKGVCAAVLRKRLSESFGMPAEGEQAEAALAAFQAATVSEASGDSKAAKKRQKKQGGWKDLRFERLDLRRLFPALAASTAEKAETVPPALPVLNMELCSGDGEWVCTQAKRDRTSCWVGCELRYDRAARCIQRFALRGLAKPASNIGIVAGDARDALERRLLAASCDHLFVNYPEPPHQTDLSAAERADAAAGPSEEGEAKNAEDAEEEPPKKANVAEKPAEGEDASTHLLTPAFLRDGCGRLLRPGGTLTICTDSREYGCMLMRALAQPELTEVFEDALHGRPGAGKKNAVDKAGKVALRSSPPPVSLCGGQYEGDGEASYFQRLKRSEKLRRSEDDARYFLCVKRRGAEEEP